MPPPPGTELETASWAFLRAEWRRLCLLTYAVEPARLEPFLPPGLELDLRDGQAFVSLVAFDFLRTRVFGVPWPGYRDFPEINLRFYVRQGERRGVAFLREYVPRRLIAWMARLLYNEPYRYAPMQSSTRRDEGGLEIHHSLRVGGREHTLRVRAESEPCADDPSSEAHFFKEHSWGYGTSRRGGLITYEVRHPVWETYAVRDFDLAWDWGLVYGDAWADLGEREPVSILLAEGSAVAVSPC